MDFSWREFNKVILDVSSFETQLDWFRCVVAHERITRCNNFGTFLHSYNKNQHYLKKKREITHFLEIKTVNGNFVKFGLLIQLQFPDALGQQLLWCWP